jgi:hypothetical protein
MLEREREKARLDEQESRYERTVLSQVKRKYNVE